MTLGKRVKWVGGGALAAFVVTIVALNLGGGEAKFETEIPHLYGVDDPQFVRSMGALLGPGLLPGNKVTQLVNGDQIFPAMLEAIRGARQTITFETYIYWSGQVGKQFAEALSERARAGVKVHVVLDWLGSQKTEEELLEAMKAAGVELELYHPLHWYSLDRINNRTHRKLLVIDGRIGFTGGVGIADLWSGDAQDPEHWRDSHYRLEGPAVAQMQSVFLDNWVRTRRKVLDGPGYYPPLEARGDQLAQVFGSIATEGVESARLMYLLSIAAARRSIHIANAYFIPDDLSVRMLVAARKRGVAVEILVPGRHIDSKLVRKAARSFWGALLSAGVTIHEYQPTMMHAKVMIVDGLWMTVGSTNFDPRSFRLNDEANLNVLDATLAREGIAAFVRDRTRSRRITLEMWRARPWTERFSDWAAGLLRPQM